MGKQKHTKMAKGSRWKLLLFRLILLSPLLVLLLVLGAFGLSIVRVNRVGQGVVMEEMEAVARSMPPAPFKLKGTETEAAYQEMEGPNRKVKVRPDDQVIFTFGGSSLFFPEGESMPKQLQRLARQEGHKVSVANFSFYGLRVFDLATRVKHSLAWRKPDLVIYYGGHNDYSFWYRNHVLPHFYILEPSPVLRWLTMRVEGLVTFLSTRIEMNWGGELSNFPQVVLEPALLSWTQRMGLVTISSALFEKVDRLALDRYKQYLARIVQVTGEAKVPLLIITPVGNLHEAPVGIGGDAEALFRQGLQETDHSKHVALLRQARDAERFNFTIRAKEPLLAHLRSLPADNHHVSLLDLASLWPRAGQHLDQQIFSDSIHLIPKLHNKMARRVLAHVESQGLLDGAR
jgi:lysophospholipase L1-like esterase